MRRDWYDQSTDMIDAARFASAAEKMTNEALIDAATELYSEDAVADWIIDGAVERHRGRIAIHSALTTMAATWNGQQLRVQKHVQCATDDTVVLTWTGGFRGARNQFGVEIWTFRAGQVTHHQMYGYLDVRPSNSLLARARLLVLQPRVAISYGRSQLRREPGK